jgi:hypothetical protein
MRLRARGWWREQLHTAHCTLHATGAAARAAYALAGLLGAVGFAKAAVLGAVLLDREGRD